MILSDWQRANTRHHPIQEYRELCHEILAEWEVMDIDVHAFCKRNYERWQKNIQGLKDGYNFKSVAGKLIENKLAEQFPDLILPVRVKEVIDYLKIKPSFKLKEIMNTAHLLFQKYGYNKTELLAALAEEYASEKGV